MVRCRVRSDFPQIVPGASQVDEAAVGGWLPTGTCAVFCEDACPRAPYFSKSLQESASLATKQKQLPERDTLLNDMVGIQRDEMDFLLDQKTVLEKLPLSLLQALDFNLGPGY